MSFKFLQCGTHFWPIVETIPQTSTLRTQAYLTKFSGSLNLGTATGTAALDSYWVFFCVNNSVGKLALIYLINDLIHFTHGGPPTI